ncbi:MAG TPA: hypothetical protein QF753_07190 [Victivallales bacterium]|nr:hypothetical protein [Victivallales bacterium]
MNLEEIRSRINAMPEIINLDDYRNEIVMMKSKGYSTCSIRKKFTEEFNFQVSQWKIYNYLKKYPITTEELKKYKTK